MSDGATTTPNAGSRARRASAAHVAVIGLFVLAILYTLHAARGLLVPIVIAQYLTFLLLPPVRWLHRHRVPFPVAGALVLLVFVSAAALLAYEVASPAAQWTNRLPESLHRVEQRFRPLREPVQEVSRAAQEVQKMTEMTTEEGRATPEVRVKDDGNTLFRRVFGGTIGFLSSLVVIVFLTYFLLASGDMVLERLIRALPQLADKKKAVAIARDIEKKISTYLSTITTINAAVGLLTALAMRLIGMPNPLLWGAIAGLLNFVPYLGAIGTVTLLTLAGLLTFEGLGHALLAPACFVVINILESYVVTPFILGFRLILNPLVIFLGLLFWSYVWGIAGSLLAVPMVVVFGILCEHVASLRSIGEFLRK
ncbi:MAG: AI-2E family transporter [Candidatus Eisenbacteria bacterium]